MRVRRLLAAPVTALLLMPAVASAHGRNYRPVWKHEISSSDKQWYRLTARCESGNNPWINTGNGYYGAVQWLPATWQAAGGTGLPIYHGRHEQAVRAIRWRNIAGSGQWPNCAPW